MAYATWAVCQGSVKGRVHVRISHLPPIPELYKASISQIRSTDIGRLIQVSGTGEPNGHAPAAREEEDDDIGDAAAGKWSMVPVLAMAFGCSVMLMYH
jgi:hypothetical protein